MFYSPTAESFGVSAQIGSGVVRGSPEVRFHDGSTRVPPEFHQVLRGLRGGPGWFEVRFHQVLRGGPGWFDVRFHETRVPHRVPPGPARAAGWSGVV